MNSYPISNLKDSVLTIIEEKEIEEKETEDNNNTNEFKLDEVRKMINQYYYNSKY